jgi:hypothetical protein
MRKHPGTPFSHKDTPVSFRPVIYSKNITTWALRFEYLQRGSSLNKIFNKLKNFSLLACQAFILQNQANRERALR